MNEGFFPLHLEINWDDFKAPNGVPECVFLIYTSL